MLGRKQRSELAMEAMKRAMSVRASPLKVDVYTPICIYDAAEVLQVRVIFERYSSIEGIYAKGNPATIVLTSLRPRGRQAFTHPLFEC